MNIILIVLLLLLDSHFTALQTVEAKKRLVQVQILYRHGARYFVENMNNIPDTGIPVTNAGLAQMEYLGRLLQRRYLADPNNPEALALRDVDRIYRPGTVFSRSTNVDQTIASADALLQGFYPPTGINYDTGLTSGYQSIPVHSISAQLDNLIGAYRVCPTLNTEINKFFNSKDFNEKQIETKEIRDYLHDVLEMNTGLENIFVAYDRVHLFKEYGHTDIDSLNVMLAVNDTMYAELVEMANFVESSIYSSEVAGNKCGGALLNEMLVQMENMSKKNYRN